MKYIGTFSVAIRSVIYMDIRISIDVLHLSSITYIRLPTR